MSQQGTITVATANTYFGQALHTPGGLAPVRHADIWLLQEVFIEPPRLKTSLKKQGFTLLYAAPHFGLAIAINKSSSLKPIANSAQKHQLAPMSKLEQRVVKKAHKQPLSLLGRGMISHQLKTINGEQFTVATAHPTTPVSLPPHARYRQIQSLKRTLRDYYARTALILGGDMNHYPGPKKVDYTLHHAASLTPINLGSAPTWHVRGSKQEKYIAPIARLLRKPLNAFDGQHDIILYKESRFTPVEVTVMDIDSDHRAIVATFKTHF